jgi:hypothetical protein
MQHIIYKSLGLWPKGTLNKEVKVITVLNEEYYKENRELKAKLRAAYNENEDIYINFNDKDSLTIDQLKELYQATNFLKEIYQDSLKKMHNMLWLYGVLEEDLSRQNLLL